MHSKNLNYLAICVIKYQSWEQFDKFKEAKKKKKKMNVENISFSTWTEGSSLFNIYPRA